MAVLYFLCGAVFGAGCVLVWHDRPKRRAKAAAQAWGDGACSRRPDDYNSGPPRPVPPERET